MPGTMIPTPADDELKQASNIKLAASLTIPVRNSDRHYLEQRAQQVGSKLTALVRSIIQDWIEEDKASPETTKEMGEQLADDCPDEDEADEFLEQALAEIANSFWETLSQDRNAKFRAFAVELPKLLAEFKANSNSHAGDDDIQHST